MKLEDIISWVLKIAVVPIFGFFVKVNNDLLKAMLKIAELQGDMLEINKKLHELEERRAKDLIEYSSVVATIKTIDTIIDNKLTTYFKEAAQDRQRQSEALNTTFGELKTTLQEIAIEMKYMRRDVDDVKRRQDEP